MQAYPKNGTLALADGDSVPYDGLVASVISVAQADRSFIIKIDDTYELVGRNNKRYRMPEGKTFTKVEVINESGATLNFQLEIGDGGVESDDVTIVGTVAVAVQAHSGLSTSPDDSITANTTEEVLAANTNRKEAWITNLSANTDVIRVGDSSTDATQGFEIAPGQTAVIQTTAAIYVHNTKASDQSVALMEIE
jgi:hypothetical protein